MNPGVHVSFSIMVFSRYIPSSVVAGSYCRFIPSVSRNLHTVLYSGSINLHSHQQCRSVPFSNILSSIYCFRFFDDVHSLCCEVISHCSFDFHFPNNEWFWASFYVFIGHLYVFFGEKSLNLLPTFFFFFNWAVCFSDTELYAVFTHFGNFVSCLVCNYFFPILSAVI